MDEVPQKRKLDNELVRESEQFYAIQEAKKEKAIEIAINCKNFGYSVKYISVATGLSIEEIEKL